MRSLALVLVLAAAACGGNTPVAVPPKPAPPPAKPAIPPCPENIVSGGDPLEAEGFEGKPVVRVCVMGGSEESRRAAQRVIELRPSDVFSADRVRADLEAILKLGIFDDAAAFGLHVQQGASVALFYTVRDRPRVAEIAFEGAKLLGDAALNAKLPIQKNSPYDPAKVNIIAQAVHEEYRTRGYESCKVTLVAEPMPDRALVRVRLEVDEGPLWHFTKVEFRGNKKVSEADLRKIANLKVGQPFVQDDVDRANLLLSALYFDRGYIQMRIENAPGPMTGAGDLPMAFVIEEGDVYTIGALHVTKLGAPGEKEILEKVIRARPKQVFSRGSLVEDVERMKVFFERRGQHVEISPLTEIDAKKKTIDLTLQVEAR